MTAVLGACAALAEGAAELANGAKTTRATSAPLRSLRDALIVFGFCSSILGAADGLRLPWSKRAKQPWYTAKS
jgi:hypothetical protein